MIQPTRYASAWLDYVAGALSFACAVHCLITPVLLIAAPVLVSTFLVHKNFHIWMLLLVLPTTTLAVFLGCRKHKDRLVVALSASGLLLLASAGIYESIALTTAVGGDVAHCPSCAGTKTTGWISSLLWVNLAGGFLLISAHIRNFRICRRHNCCHG